jgi:ketosteroid isomerase-like protein
MSEQSATPDLLELARKSIEAEDREAALSFYASNAVWDASHWGMGVFESRAAVRAFFEDWGRPYVDMEWKAEEIRDLGGGVTFAVILQQGRVAESSASVQLRYASVTEWIDGLIVRNTTYADIDEGRADAERVAREGTVGAVAGERVATPREE